ncbi:hypothetical protein T310_10173, partial [Rasamsonia emersonii CBS 393.64]
PPPLPPTSDEVSSGRRCSPTRTGRLVDWVLVDFCSVGDRSFFLAAPAAGKPLVVSTDSAGSCEGNAKPEKGAYLPTKWIPSLPARILQASYGPTNPLQR